MRDITFKNLFFRYYDRKIADGTITFSKLGITKTDFTRLCVEEDFLFDEDTLIKICNLMKLTEEEENLMKLTEEEETELFDAAERLRKEKRDREYYI